ncbi:MAG: aspartyl protease family protein [Candidatus Eremiobacteraeota bacterium]|nr:aspartyl protease family protein [Candidatus Eremiobacteraeota bacterium]
MSRFSLALALLMFGTAVPASSQAAGPRAEFAAEHAAVGGAAWNSVGGILTSGTQVSGGAPASFRQVVDHRTGFSRETVDSGPLHDVSGFDGTTWDAHNGIVSQADLPGIVADGVTGAYMARDGWWNANDAATMTALPSQTLAGRSVDVISVVPRGGSPVDVWLDRSSHLIVRTVQHTDSGDVTSDYLDYRTTNGARVPYRITTVDPTQAHTDVTVASATLLRAVPKADLQRPATDPRGSFSGAPPAVVPFRLGSIDTGHVVVDATFGGKPATLIFDTGGANYLVPDAARRLGLVTGGGADISGVGNASQAVSFANVGAIDVGSSRLRDQTAIVAPLPYFVQHERAGVTADGLIGFETLSAFRTTFDYAARTLTLAPFDSPPPTGGTTVHFVSEGVHAYVPVTIDGATGLFGLDTGDSGALTVFRRFARAHGIFSGPGVPFVAAGGVGGTLGFSLYRGTSMTIGRTTLPAPVVTVTDAAAGAFASRSIDGNIGARILERFKVTFDFRARTVTFVPNDRVNEHFEANRTGMSLNQTDPNAFVVLSVAPNSPASDVGIRAGDRIVTVDGRSVAGEHLGGGDLTPIVKNRTADLPLVIRRGTSDINVVLKPRELV